MSTHLDKKDLAKTTEGVGICTNTKKGDARICSNNRTIDSPDIACQQNYGESHSAQIGYAHGARNGNITGRFQERKRYTRSNLEFTMNNGKGDIIYAL